MTGYAAKFYLYPDGLAKSMGQDEIVLVRNKLGSLEDRYVGDLIKGDYYCVRIPNPLPPRAADSILEYIAKNRISFNYIQDNTGATKLIEVVKNLDFGKSVLCQYEYAEMKTCIRESIEPLMDMEEL